MNTEWIFVKPISEEIIRQVEKLYDVSLPKDLKEFLKANNNGRPVKALFDSEKIKNLVLKLILPYEDVGYENVFCVAECINKENPDLFPIASEDDGKLICLEKASGHLVHYDEETKTIDFVATSIEDLCKALH